MQNQIFCDLWIVCFENYFVLYVLNLSWHHNYFRVCLGCREMEEEERRVEGKVHGMY